MKELNKIFQGALSLGVSLLIILVVAVALLGVHIVPDGFVGVKQTLGNYNDLELGTGVHLVVPFLSTVYQVDTRKITISEAVDVPSKEGLIINLEMSVIYRVKSDRASEIKQTVSGSIEDTLLVPYIRTGIRDLASGYAASAFYSQDTRKQIADTLKVNLETDLNENLIVEDVLLRKVTLPARVTQAIEDKLDAEQKSQKKEFELVSAQKDAEIEVERAKGIAEANEIIAESITDGYLHYRFIEGLNDGNTEVIYVPTETNLPILEARNK